MPFEHTKIDSTICMSDESLAPECRRMTDRTAGGRVRVAHLGGADVWAGAGGHRRAHIACGEVWGAVENRLAGSFAAIDDEPRMHIRGRWVVRRVLRSGELERPRVYTRGSQAREPAGGRVGVAHLGEADVWVGAGDVAEHTSLAARCGTRRGIRLQEALQPATTIRGCISAVGGWCGGFCGPASLDDRGYTPAARRQGNRRVPGFGWHTSA
jgi:hypothetical protein